jgi:hypothetical protein
MRLRGLAVVAGIAAVACAPQAAFARKSHPGPCRQGQVTSLVNRPGVGPLPTVSGSPCTVAKGRGVLEFGYRNETDAGKNGTSNLSTLPMSVLRYGLGKHDEIMVMPPTSIARTSSIPGLYAASRGSEDTGFGWKHSIQSHWWYQDAVEVFVTEPTGTGGFSAGGPTYSFSYIGAFSPPGKLGVTTQFAVVNAPGAAPDGYARRFASFQPAVTVTYAIGPATSILLNDNFFTPVNPLGGTSNVLLVAAQRTLSVGTVIDFDTEFNLTPAAGYRERAIGFGGAFLL